MKDEIVQIINKLMSSDTSAIQEATRELDACYKQPEAITTLCDLLFTGQEPQVRQYSAFLLSRRLCKSRHWKKVPNEHKRFIRRSVLSALENEPEKCVRNAISVFVGTLVSYADDKMSDAWLNDLLNFVQARCNSPDEAQRELGSSLFATITEVSPDLFVSIMEETLTMFFHVLSSAESAGNMATPAIADLMRGMYYLLCLVQGFPSSKAALQNGMPLILKSIHGFAHNSNTNLFIRAFELIDGLAEIVPSMLRLCFEPMLEMCLEVAKNEELPDTVRVQCLLYIKNLACLNRKSFVQEQFLRPTITLAFSMMCSDSDTLEGVDDDEIISGAVGSCPISAGSRILHDLAEILSAHIFITPMLELVEPALQSHNELHRRAAYLCLGVIVEGCSEVIINKYLKNMCNICWQGLTDNSNMVRSSAFFALSLFSVYLQPDVCEHLELTMGAVCNLMHEICENAKLGLPEPPFLDRMFASLENFTEFLEEEIEPYLPGLMERVFECLHQQYSPNLRRAALSLVSALATAARRKFHPYFMKIINFLEIYLFTDELESEFQEFRTMCIDTLAAIAREISSAQFYPIANDAFNLCLKLMEREDEAKDPDCRRAIFNLIGSLTFVVKDEMPDEVLQVTVPILMTVLSNDFIPQQQERSEQTRPKDKYNKYIQTANYEDDDDNDDDDEDDMVVNDYLSEKEEAVRVVKDISTNSCRKFMPYFRLAYETISKLLDFRFENIRAESVSSLLMFSTSLYKADYYDDAKSANAIILPKIYHLIATDESIRVVTNTCEMLAELMKELKEETFPNGELRDGLFEAIINILNGQVHCQNQDEVSFCLDLDDSDDERFFGERRLLDEAASNLVPISGNTMKCKEFSLYFNRIYPLFLTKLENAMKDDDFGDIRLSIYGTLGDCFSPLGMFCADVFDELCPIMLKGLTDTHPRARQNACLGLGELVLLSREKSYGSFQIILNSVFNLMSEDTTPATQDYICSIVARLILTNHTLVPMPQIIPVWLSKMPLRKHMNQYPIIFECLNKIFTHYRGLIENHLKSVLEMAALVLHKKYFNDHESCEPIINLSKNIKDLYPAVFHDLSNVDATQYTFLNDILHYYF